MSSRFEKRIAVLAEAFAAQVVTELRTMSLLEAFGEGEGRPPSPKRARRANEKEAAADVETPAPKSPPESTEAGVERLVKLLWENPAGLRAEQLRAQLGVSADDLRRFVTFALEAERIVKRGEKRGTTYFAR